jgi:hypothetical protein
MLDVYAISKVNRPTRQGAIATERKNLAVSDLRQELEDPRDQHAALSGGQFFMSPDRKSSTQGNADHLDVVLFLLYIITIADDDRAPLDKLCRKLIAADATCDVLRNPIRQDQ